LLLGSRLSLGSGRASHTDGRLDVNGRVLFLSSSLFTVWFFSELWADVIWNKLENHVEDEHKKGWKSSPQPLVTSKSLLMHFEDSTCELDHDVLTKSDDNPNDDEQWVVQNTCEDVELIVDLSGADHVENLEPHEDVENGGHVSRVRHLLEY
jgi:hypothetical protein